MASVCFQSNFFPITCHRFLTFHNSGDRLESYPEIDIFSVRHAPLYTSRAIRRRVYFTSFHDKRIVMPASLHRGCCKSASVFKTFGCVDTHHCMRQSCLKTVEHRFA